MYDHIKHRVIDESGVVPEMPVAQRILGYIIPLFSSKGDREFHEISTLSDAITIFGEDFDNFEKYGQGGLNLSAALTGGSTVYACRLLPDDAKTAHVVLCADVKEDAAIPQYKRLYPKGPFELDANGNKIPLLDPVTNDPVVATGLSIELTTIHVDDIDNFNVDSTMSGPNGRVRYPLFKIKHYSPGKQGNSFGLTINIDSSRDKKVFDGRRYFVNLYEYQINGNLSLLQEDIFFALNKDAKDPVNSKLREAFHIVYPEKLDSGYKNPILIEFSYSNYEEVLKLAQTYETDIPMYDIDILFARDKNGIAYDKIVLSDASIKLADDFIIFMDGGTDGSLEEDNIVKDINNNDIVVDKNLIRVTKEKLLIDFWNCDYNVDLLDRRLVPGGFAFDCIDYSNAVKAAMINMQTWRDDVFVFLGYVSKSPKEALQLLGSVKSLVNGERGWNVGITPHAGWTTDRVDNKYVLATYEIARGMIECYAQFGKFTTYAGYKAGQVKYMKLDWTAKLMKNDLMQELEDAGLIYAQVLDRSGRIAFMNASSQYYNSFSKMRFWRNGAIIGDAIRSAHQILIKYKYDPQGATRAIPKAQQELIEFFAENPYPESVKVEANVYQTKRDKQTENASCDIIFYFPGEITGWNVTIKARREENAAG